MHRKQFNSQASYSQIKARVLFYSQTNTQGKLWQLCLMIKIIAVNSRFILKRILFFYGISLKEQPQKEKLRIWTHSRIGERGDLSWIQ